MDFHYLYLASVLMSASASEVNICNSHNSLIFQARRPKFCKVVDLYLHYLYLASVLMSASSSASASEVNISSSHNSFIFQARRPKFCKVVDLNLHYLYLASVLMSAKAEARYIGSGGLDLLHCKILAS